MRKVKEFWNKVASGWDVQVGKDGDRNRRLNSDPVLWHFAGEVDGLNVLDAGCGTGYLTKKLVEKGAHAIGVDLSEKMIEIAEKNVPEASFYVDSLSDCTCLESGYFDLIISNYVLMDTPDLDGTMRSFRRLVRDDGEVVLIFSHPCFPQGKAKVIDENGKRMVRYLWDIPYFEEREQKDPPWAHFQEAFVWYHRPLSRYWEAFKDSGFTVIDMDEPRISLERSHLVKNQQTVTDYRERPYSIAFKLRKIN